MALSATTASHLLGLAEVNREDFHQSGRIGGSVAGKLGPTTYEVSVARDAVDGDWLWDTCRARAQISYAPTGRSKCHHRQCKCYIRKNALRIGKYPPKLRDLQVHATKDGQKFKKCVRIIVDLWPTRAIV